MSDYHNNKPFKPTKSGIVKAIIKKIGSLGKDKSGDGKAIKSFKPGTKFEGIPKYQKEIIKARSNVQKSFKHSPELRYIYI